MGWIENAWPIDFFKNRQGDFVKLDKQSPDAYGPGPLLLLYNVPDAIDDLEIRDMMEDAAPHASQQCRIFRLDDNEDSPTVSDLLDLTLQGALDEMMRSSQPLSSLSDNTIPSPTAASQSRIGTPVLYFSGFTNTDMMAVYSILGPEILAETKSYSSDERQTLPAACAKVVPPAISKSLRQVLFEITEDHEDAMGSVPESVSDST